MKDATRSEAYHIGGVIVVTLLVSAIALASWVFRSYCEAAAYERATGKHVDTWDAMWLDLRVQEPTK